MPEKLKQNGRPEGLVLKAAAGMRDVLRKALGIEEQPFARELVEDTIYIDHKLRGQLVIPHYAEYRSTKETVWH